VDTTIARLDARKQPLGLRPIADTASSCHASAMTRLRHLFPILAVSLGSCSYAYDLKAVVIGGRLAFVVDPTSRHNASCINQIDVIASGGVRAKPAPGDDVSRMSYGTVWHQRLNYDCIDAFPIFYGQRLKGKPSPLGRAIQVVSAKPLKIGVV
jgi:hypothetical protein